MHTCERQVGNIKLIEWVGTQGHNISREKNGSNKIKNITVSTANCKRSFSKLKITQNLTIIITKLSI